MARASLVPPDNSCSRASCDRQCSSELLSKAIDRDETSLWQCALWDERQALTIDLGDVRTVGSVVNNLGSFSWLFPAALDGRDV